MVPLTVKVVTAPWVVTVPVMVPFTVNVVVLPWIVTPPLSVSAAPVPVVNEPTLP